MFSYSVFLISKDKNNREKLVDLGTHLTKKEAIDNINDMIAFTKQLTLPLPTNYKQKEFYIITYSDNTEINRERI